MASALSWNSLIRFRDPENRIFYGEPDDNLKAATIWEGSSILNLRPASKEQVDVAEVLAPFIPDTILCIGLNYKEHAAESGVSN